MYGGLFNLVAQPEENFITKKTVTKKKRSRSQVRQSIAQHLEMILHQFLHEIDEVIDLLLLKDIHNNQNDFNGRLDFLKNAHKVLITGPTDKVPKNSNSRKNIQDTLGHIVKTCSALEHEIAWRLREFLDDETDGVFMRLGREQLEVLDQQLQKISEENEAWLSKLRLLFHKSCDRIKK